MDINTFLQGVRDSVTKNPQSLIPGYGFGQAIKGAMALPKHKKEQDSISQQMQALIDERLAEEALLRANGIKPNYAKSQQMYEQKAAQEKQFAEDIQAVQQGGVNSIATSALTLALPAIGKYINRPMMRNVKRDGGMPKAVYQTLIENILSNLTRK